LNQRVLMTDEVDRATDVLLAAASDPTRWRILHLLAAEELCTTHLQDELGLKQNLVSHHLRVLREAGLVDTAPCGRFTYYRLRAGALDDLGDAVRSLASAARATPARRAC
jgi:ArsR family transcriptional regulator